MSPSTKHVEVTQKVPVDSLETLRTYLVNELEDVGGTALDLILSAGFTVKIIKTRKKRQTKAATV